MFREMDLLISPFFPQGMTIVIEDTDIKLTGRLYTLMTGLTGRGQVIVISATNPPNSNDTTGIMRYFI